MMPVKYEIRSLASVGVVTLGIALAFPSAAFNFAASRKPMPHLGSAAFVTLTFEQEEAAMKAAKSAWRLDSSSMECMRVRLPLGELPEEETGSPLGAGEVLFIGEKRSSPVAYPLPAYAPSFAAREPDKLPSEERKISAPVVFSREELLGLNNERKLRQ